MDVSVIITAYNVEKYIGRAIESALSQQGVSVEVIVVDDCSGDNTWNIISETTDPRFKKVRLDRNGGPGAARNAGIAIASGEWIAVLDGDDTFEAGRLARCVSKAKQGQADIVVDNLTVCREADGREFQMFPPEIFSKITVIDTATFITGTLSAKSNYTLGYLKPVFSKAFLQRHHLSYDAGLRIGEDYVLMTAALLSGARCVIEPSAGYRYTARCGSISYRLSPDDINRMLKADHDLLSRYTFDKTATAAQSHRTQWLRREYAYTQLIHAIKQKNGHNALKALALHPSCIWLLWRPLQVRLKRWVAV